MSFRYASFKEIVLSGIDITSYGKDLDYQIDLSDVILAILKSNPELRRLRISSIDNAIFLLLII